MSEEWRAVLGFGGRYEVSSEGRVRGPRQRAEMRQLTDRHGYRYLALTTLGGQVKRKVHQLVLEAFVGPRPSPIHEVAHTNGVRSDNRLSNLRWATRVENAADKAAHGTTPRREKHGRARLTSEQVGQIRGLLTKGATAYGLSKQFGVSAGAIHHIRTGRNWK